MHNETFLMKLHGRPLIWTLNNVLLSFPSDDTKSYQEKSPMAHDSNDENESSTALTSVTAEMKSPMTHDSDNEKEESPTALSPTIQS